MAKRWISSLVVVAAVAVGGVLLANSGGTLKQVEVQAAQLGTVTSTLEITGDVTPKNQQEVLAHMQGQIEEIYVVEGQTVKKGDKLVDWQTASAQEEVQSVFSDSMANQLPDTYTIEEKQRNALLLSQVAGMSLDTFNELFLSPEQEQAQSAMSTLEEQLGEIGQQSVTSDIDGTILSVNAKDEDFLAAGASILTVADTENLKIVCQINEKDMNEVWKGQRVIIYPNDGSAAIQGKITKKGSVAQATTQLNGSTEKKGTIEITPEQTLDELVGASIDVDIVLDQLEQAIKIPIDAIVDDNKVFVYDDGMVYEREVVLGANDSTDVAVLEGLLQGEQVVLNPDEDLQSGQKVEKIDQD